MNLPLFFISSRHPLGVQGDMQSSKSPRESFPAFDSWSLHKFKKVSKIQHVWNSFKIFEEALVLFFLDKAPVLLLRTSWVHNIRIEKINSKAGGCWCLENQHYVSENIFWFSIPVPGTFIL